MDDLNLNVNGETYHFTGTEEEIYNQISIHLEKALKVFQKCEKCGREFYVNKKCTAHEQSHDKRFTFKITIIVAHVQTL